MPTLAWLITFLKGTQSQVDFINAQIVKVQAAFAAREEGQAMVEYGLILVLVSVVAVLGLTAIGTSLWTAGLTDPTTGTGVFNQVLKAFKGG
jgi:Flp pilus assembly pilin Flp